MTYNLNQNDLSSFEFVIKCSRLRSQKVKIMD